MCHKTYAAYAAPSITAMLSYEEQEVLCASIDNVSEEEFEFDWI